MDIRQALGEHAQRSPDNFAFLSLGRAPLPYSRLLTHCYRMITDLNQVGISRGDRVAVVLPNGPEMAACVLAVAMGASCTPLNANYRRSEFEFFLSDLAPRALIVEEVADLPAIAVAESLGIRVIRLRPSTADAAGIFTLDLEPAPANVTPVFAEPGDEALVLHTSGTTARPKMVTLTQSNLAASARSIAESLVLDGSDRCLNVMPLFHIHGFAGALLSTIVSGGSLVCTPGFQAPRFLEWCDEFAPTWYTAVPTMHQAVLARATENLARVSKTSFRFIRSCSAPLSPQLMGELEQTFRVPVLEAYGMTEAAHQIATNPKPPAVRKPGSVGRAFGTEAAIMDADGNLLAPGEIGEIVLRGPAVISGYANNPEANSKSFVNGWFRTGDNGRLDRDGYLFITGRIKEIINRGGQKISPREVDEVLCTHPAVANAVAFAVPDHRLGEDIAAAVVLRPGHAASEIEIKNHAANLIAQYKVPRRIVFLDELPKGPTGKLQRIGLAAQLGIAGDSPESLTRAPYVAPSSETEKALWEIWTSLLRVEHIGIHDSFLSLGGDSLLLAQLLLRLHEAGWPKVSILSFFDRPTIAGLAELIDSEGKDTDGAADQSWRVLSVQHRGLRTPIFLIRGFTIFCDLSRLLGDDQPIYSLLDPEIMDITPPYDFAEIAKIHVQTILAVRPHGPYVIGGFSAGGGLAYEVAQQLVASGHEVPLLVLFDSACPVQPSMSWIRTKVSNARIHLRELRWIGFDDYSKYLAPIVNRRIQPLKSWIRSWVRGGGADPLEQPVSPNGNPSQAFLDASHGYRPQPYSGRTILFKRTRWISSQFALPDCGWGAFIPDKLEVCLIAGDHFSMFVQPGVAILADKLGSILDEVSEESSPSGHSFNVNSSAVAD